MQKFALSLLLLSGVSLFAQSDRGAISGRVADPTTAPIPNASVTAVHQATGIKYTATTNETGNYLIAQLPVGRYDVSAEAAGFRRYSRPNIDIGVAQTVTLNLDMQLGQVEQTLEVTAAAPVVEATNADVGTSVNTKQVIDLPLAVSGNMRNPESFMFLTPGVTTAAPGDTQNVQVNGSPSRGREILIDGASATNPESGGLLFTYPSVEAIGEFRLVNMSFSAEYGRTGGGYSIYTTRSGTNDLHGSVFDYLRNDVFDARGFIARTRPVNRQNEFGAAIGGPIVLPKLYNGRNRTFFHVVYSGFRWRSAPVNEMVTLPTAEMRRGDFSRVGRNIYDPRTTAGNVREQFAGNIIPENRFSAVARNIIELLPPTTNNNLTNNFLVTGAQKFDRDQINLKLDHAVSDRNRLSGFVYIGTQQSVEPERLPVPFSGALDEDRRSRWARLNHDYIFSPSTLNHLIVGFTREGQFWQKLSANQDWPNRIGLKGVNTGPGNVFPTITFTDALTLWGESPAVTGPLSKSVGQQVNNVWQVSDNVSHIHGSHTLKFGVDYRYQQTNGADPANSQGRFSFTNLETAQPGVNNTGHAWASFLLGAVNAARYTELVVVPGLRYKYFAWYVQDDWKISPKLTLNVGLRHEIFFPRTERFRNLSGFDPDLANPGANGRPGALAFLGEGAGRNGRSSFADTDFRAFGPRFGFAYSMTDRTVLRGGYGISYAAGNAAAGLRQSQGFSLGFNAQPTPASTNAGVTPAFYIDDGFPHNYRRPPVIDPAFANGSDIAYMGRGDGRVPYFQNWAFNVQRELPASVLAEVGYVGVKGTRLGNNLINVNELDPKYLSLGTLLTRNIADPAVVAAGFSRPYPTFNGSLAQALRPYPQFGNIVSRSNPNGNSTYHALQTKLEKRLSRGVTFLAAYTWSKSISDSDIIAGLGPAGQTYYNRRLEKAISTNDIPHNFALSYVWDLPFGRGRAFLNGGVLATALGGWTFTGIHQYQSGRPIVLTANVWHPLSGHGILRPDVVQGAQRQLEYEKFDPAVNLWINPAAFRVPAQYRYGTSARSWGDLRADGFMNESFGLIKRTPITERVNLTFRAEFFNALNRTVFRAPESNVSNANFGKVAAQANTPRQGQLALRVDF
ncbi:MAG TPA: TonB-dependent receptor [Bryobacteraceae bacterium]|nr:TonB-dependent receptor [Bryobacteraceae bacterium]